MYRTLNALLLLLLVSSLSGCASLFGGFFGESVKPVEVSTKAIDKTPLNTPAPTPLELSKPTWVIITRDNAQEVFDMLEKNGSDPVIFGLTDKGYERLSIDFAEIRNFISTQRNIIIQYKQYYEPTPPAVTK
jgi:hypothetical protein